MMRSCTLCLILIVIVCLQISYCDFVHRPPMSMLHFCARNVSDFGIISRSRFRPVDFLLICSLPREIENCLQFLRSHQQDVYPMKNYELYFPMMSDLLQAIYIYCIEIYPKDVLIIDKINETQLYPCERKIDFGLCSINANYDDYYHLSNAITQGNQSEIIIYSCRITFLMTLCRWEEYQKCPESKLDSFFELLFGILGPDCLNTHNHESQIWKNCEKTPSTRLAISLAPPCPTISIWQLVASLSLWTLSSFGRSG